MELEWAREIIEQYGYLAVFISTIAEGEVLVLAAAALTASGLMQWHWVILAASSGAFVGHLIWFVVGRWRGLQIIEAVPLLRKHYPKTNLLMDEYAHWSVFLFQYLYGLRIPSAIMFGASSITLTRFCLLQAVNCLSWAALYFFAGNMIGVATIFVYEILGMQGVVGVGALTVMVLIVLYRRYIRHHMKAFLLRGHPTVQQLESSEGRRLIDEQLPYHIALAVRQEQPLSLLLVSAPKQLRSKSSYEVLAHEVCVRLRETDIAGRIDKNTLAIIAPGIGSEESESMVIRLIRVASHRLPGATACAVVWHEGMDAKSMLEEARSKLTQADSDPATEQQLGVDLEP